MLAKIYRQEKTAMQSGKARINSWVLEFEKKIPPKINPFMGYISSKDAYQQVKLLFNSCEQAENYARAQGINYFIVPTQESMPQRISYQENFSYNRIEPWTH
ncbi:hypothetical protein B488_08870 [Liberibacter crescens BT-1]|uniref:Uncharacterized protein n=1 Tax=Liberibacter crescens (strain BT-1) TaxID=1215343 RepID=L0ETK9_LIBCB|nr:ETC complex I subunit [Liberibacter crescens]AGA64879.1 hypothetical protein B488_08870 [Liberibacter crescens BT-1]AMC12918.1 NADH-ubiquinone oxidoreductase [Liberibacter crescens]